MTYGSSSWHKEQGKAIIEQEKKCRQAEIRREMNSKRVEKLQEGKAAIADSSRGEIRGFISEIRGMEVIIENWNKSITVEARNVEMIEK